MAFRNSLLFAALFAAGFGCSSKPSHPPAADLSVEEGGVPNEIPLGGGGTADSGGADGAVADAGDDDGGTAACNTLTFDTAMVIPGNNVPDILPSATGGTILDGTYAITKYEVYTGVGGAVGGTGTTVQGVAVFAGTLVEAYIVRNSVSASRTTYTFATEGMTLTSTNSCPDKTTRSDGYSVINGNAIALFTSTAKEILTFTKQ